MSMNTEVDFSTGSEQWRFLEQALASVDRAATPWVVFSGEGRSLLRMRQMRRVSSGCHGCNAQGRRVHLAEERGDPPSGVTGLSAGVTGGMRRM